ncbi:MAG: YbjQ family protein [Methanobacterium paludis]|nr:YbjQ family protein [Methanobacterium paludis]
MPTSIKKSLKEKRWAIVAIILGILVGFISAFLCVLYNLVIFGFNIMYIVSPLMAGFVETIIARKKYGESIGAISALLTFILINVYGWFYVGWVTNNPVTFNLITLIAIILTIQAAFPIFMNYVLFVVGVSILRKIIGALVYLPSKIWRKPPEVEEEISGPSTDEILVDELNMPLVSVPHVAKGKIKRNIGLVTGEAIAEEKESEGLLLKLLSIIQPIELGDINLEKARKEALSRMLQNAKSIGADTVIEVLIDYISVGGLQGNALIVTATGTAVIYE